MALFKETDPEKSSVRGKQKSKRVPYVKGISSSIATLPNYEGLINSPTANKFFELVKDKNYDLGAKGISNWTSAGGGKETSPDSIDCSGAVCTVKNALGGDYDLTNTNAAKFQSTAKKKGIKPQESIDGDMIVMSTGGNGIDHIGFVVVDEEGRRYIAESSSSYNGTTITPFDDRIKDLESRHGNMNWDIVSDLDSRPTPKPYNTNYSHIDNDKVEVRPPVKVIDQEVESKKQGTVPKGATEINEPITNELPKELVKNAVAHGTIKNPRENLREERANMDNKEGKKANMKLITKDNKQFLRNEDTGDMYVSPSGGDQFTEEEMVDIEKMIDSTEADVTKMDESFKKLSDEESKSLKEWADNLTPEQTAASVRDVVPQTREKRGPGEAEKIFPDDAKLRGGRNDKAKQGRESGQGVVNDLEKGADTRDNIHDLDDYQDPTSVDPNSIQSQDDIDAIRERLKNNENLLADLDRKQPFDDSYAPDEQGKRDIGGYLVDTARGIMGAVGAQEELPTYTQSNIFKTYANEAAQRRNMGLSDEELGLRKQLAERGYGYDVKNIRRLAGGSAGVALGNLGRATGQLQDQYAETAAADEGVRRHNRALFGQAARAWEPTNRQIFEDDLTQKMMTKQAAAGLVSDSMSNIKDRKQFEDAYGKGSQLYEYQKELTLSQRQNRGMLDEANQRRQTEYLNEIRGNIDSDRALIEKATGNYTSLSGDEPSGTMNTSGYSGSGSYESDMNELQRMKDGGQIDENEFAQFTNEVMQKYGVSK